MDEVVAECTVMLLSGVPECRIRISQIKKKYSKIHASIQCRATIDPPVERLNMAFHWRTDSGPL